MALKFTNSTWNVLQNIRYANLTFCLSLIRVMAGGDEVVESLPGWQNNAIEKNLTTWTPNGDVWKCYFKVQKFYFKVSKIKIWCPTQQCLNYTRFSNTTYTDLNIRFIVIYCYTKCLSKNILMCYIYVLCILVFNMKCVFCT